MNHHQIRLRGPWLLVIHNDDTKSERRVTIPESWRKLSKLTDGPVTLSRRFNCPTRLTDADHVRLILPPIPGEEFRIWLNDIEITPDSKTSGELQIEIFPHLEPSNILVMEMTNHDDRISTDERDFEGVVIEIQSSD